MAGSPTAWEGLLVDTFPWWALGVVVLLALVAALVDGWAGGSRVRPGRKARGSRGARSARAPRRGRRGPDAGGGPDASSSGPPPDR